ncbi:hypothetical protein DICPUDRAFT_54769 [Dictyostelium purpureum]|uniref:PH domain-containing protein n=1 Tax=Dictyostelium purpureum TaxID=5786 RepID=F0ZIQ1_DICPU|nr:uncharacterized protein DICPUDRAFT_54769 [Dictyostelium purpureum]EGC36160.1 hypothetical protein DICPUDRAFT_54769 [Dictyostelium purpureum]|eukprot:XP_003287293.1 hypothetical protein DICPUDRAFT_54769 [Dictyostelium purpureum]
MSTTQTDSPSYLTNHDPKAQREGLKKRKKLEGAKESSSPLNKLRSATLRNGGTPSKLKFVVDLGSNLGKSPSKSTANALSLHSSVPQHNNYVPSPTASPILSPLSSFSNTNNLSSPIVNTPNKKHNTLHRKSMRASMQLKIDEVMKIYAPLSGSEYLNKGNDAICSNKENESESNKNVLLNSPSSSPSKNKQQPPQHSTPNNNNNNNNSSNSSGLSPVLNKLVLSPPSNKNSPTAGRSRKSILNERMMQIRREVIENAEFILAKLGEYQKTVLSLPDMYNVTNCDVINSEYAYLITNTKVITKILSPLDSSSSSETGTEIIANKNKLNQSNNIISTPLSPKSNPLSPTKDLNGFDIGGGITNNNINNHPNSSPVLLSSSSSSISSVSTLSSTTSPTFGASSAYSNFKQQQQNVGKNNQVFNSLTDMDIVAQSISIIAKKLLGIEIEIKKTKITEKRASILASFIRVIKQFLETGIVPEMPQIPSELVNSLIINPSSESVTQIYNPEESDYIYKSGYLIKKGSKGPLVVWKDQWIVLSSEKLSIYSNQNKTKKCKKEISLNSIVSISPITKYEYKCCFIVKVAGGEKYVFRGANDKETALWMLAIDGLPRRNFDTNQSSINLYIKETLLETIGSNICNYRRSVAGGVVRSSHGEEWTYRADGTLFNTDFLDTSIRPKDIKYIWNGQFLLPANDSVHNLGNGKWNGVWLAWYNPNTSEPFLKYIWDQQNNEYLNQNTKLSYKWSSRGLVSKIGNGEWLVEGRVPETIVMFLQCLRYIRHKELNGY